MVFQCMAITYLLVWVAQRNSCRTCCEPQPFKRLLTSGEWFPLLLLSAHNPYLPLMDQQPGGDIGGPCWYGPTGLCDQRCQQWTGHGEDGTMVNVSTASTVPAIAIPSHAFRARRIPMHCV